MLVNCPHLTELYAFVFYTSIIIDTATLRTLDVSKNNIGDDGMAVISEALQNNKSLTTLNGYKCGLSVKGNVVCGIYQR